MNSKKPKVQEPPKLPRGHAYIRLRNRGTTIHFDMPSVDDPIAKKMMDAALAVWKNAVEHGDA